MKALITTVLFILVALVAKAENPPETKPTSTEFNRPLPFDVMDRELKLKNIRVDYDSQKSKGKELRIGQLIFSPQSFEAHVEGQTLSFKWDKRFVKAGDISVINQQGNELWKVATNGEGESSYKDILSSRGPKWKNGENFRFCIRHEIGRGYSSICSQWYGVEIKESSVQMGLRRSQATPRVIFQNEERKTVGAEIVAPDTPVQFFASLESDMIYEYVSEPVPLIIQDMIGAEKAENVILTGVVPAPLNYESRIFSGNEYGGFTRLLGFQKTISQQPDYWQAEVPVKKSSLDIPGKSGGIFSYELEIANPPPEKSRRLLANRAIAGTYNSKETLKVSDSEGNQTDWSFDVPKKFELNRVYLEVPGEKEDHRTYLDIYRGGSGEASLRLTGVVTSDSETVVLAEGHVSWWFNDLFGWQNYWLSKQRWGVSAKYFTSLNEVKASADGVNSETVSLQVANFDVRYRFTPGLWERDETLGAILSYEALSMGSLSVPKAGVGIFWARSMPQVFDQWISALPFMKYPKWVDMEFISYINSMDSKYELKGEYVLNFHGKVLWTPQFFGEAGFGLKNYHFEQKEDGAGAKIATLYGTVGLGLNF